MINIDILSINTYNGEETSKRRNEMFKVNVIEVKSKPVTHLLVEFRPRYFEDGKVNGKEDIDGDLVPGRDGDMIIWKIELESGKILGWPEGTTGKFYYKVCDEGSYFLLDASGEVVISMEDHYVPNIIGEYGDYIDVEVDSLGVIQNWNPDLQEFEDHANS